MDANNQPLLPDLPVEHLKTSGLFCELCGKELPLRLPTAANPQGAGRKPRFCSDPIGGGRTSCLGLARAMSRVESELPPERGEIRKLKEKRRGKRRRGGDLAPEDAARLAQLEAEAGPEYPRSVREGVKRVLMRLSARLNSNGWGAA